VAERWRGLGVLLLLLAGAAAQEPPPWRAPTAEQLAVPARRDGMPMLAVSPVELERLRAAFAADVPAVRDRVARARRALADEVRFPPRGGQHNQWYQCDACQIALVTVDDTHHRCPRCEKVYSGAPWDDVVFARRHRQNLERAFQSAWAYALTGEGAFATDALVILSGYAARYEAYPYHSNDKDPSRRRDSGGHLDAQTLTEASMFVTRIAPAVDLVWPAATADERAQLTDHLVRPLVANVDKCKRGRSNWQSWHNAALCAGGVLLGDDELLRRSVLDEKNGFLFQMQACVSAEGMWYENSFGYHLYTLDALIWHAEFARRVGVDLFGNPALRRMASLPARYTMADGRLPRLGDDVDSTPQRASRALEAVFAATGDQRVLAVLPDAVSWDTIANGRDPKVAAPAATALLGSELFAEAGHALLRVGDDSTLLTFAPFGGFHGHFDKLSFVWYARGRERGVDPGRAASQAYRLPIHTQWYRATLAHNTVVVDGKSQEGAAGRLLAFEQGQGWAAVVARTTKAYRGVDHRRCLIATDGCLVVLDSLVGTAPHTYDWLYHARAEQVRADCASQRPDAPLGLAGEQFVEWTGAGQANGPITVEFADAAGALDTRLLVAAGPPTEMRLGTGPCRSVTDRLPLVLLRRSGEVVSFAAVLVAAPTAVTAIEWEPDGKGGQVTVLRGDERDVYRWDGAGSISRR